VPIRDWAKRETNVACPGCEGSDIEFVGLKYPGGGGGATNVLSFWSGERYDRLRGDAYYG